MYPHRIRLLGPWEYEVLPGAKVSPDAPLRGRITMPSTIADAGLPGFSGSIRFSRRFGMPRSHDAGEHYWLVFETTADFMEVTLNKRLLGEFARRGPFAVEVTGSLLDRNLLELTVQTMNDQDGLTGETALEIRRVCYLCDAKIWRRADGRIEASVEVAGKAPEGLELYLLAERRTLAYLRLDAAVDQLVELQSEDPVSPETTEARLELVQGGVVWFQTSCNIKANVEP
jgi:hypothetical protein